MEKEGRHMSRSVLVVAALALLLAAGAVVIHFVLPTGEGASSPDLKALQQDVAELQQQTSAPSLRIAYMDAEDAFSVFLDAVSDLRQRAMDKQAEIYELQAEFVSSTISKEDYQQRYDELAAELLDAKIDINMGTIDKMIASDHFADIRSELEMVREEAQKIVDEMNDLLSTVKLGIIDPLEFQNRYSTIEAAFTQLDQTLTSAASQKIVQATEKIATQYRFDLVVRVKDVLLYRNPESVTDITDLVKAEIATYL
jgi:chromosome segregation ATPase